MKRYIYKQCWQGNLPHIHPPGATLFITFRLAGTVPQAVLRLWQAQKNWLAQESVRLGKLGLNDVAPELQAHQARLDEFRRRWFAKFEQVLDAAQSGPRWLQDERAATLLAEALRHRDGVEYRLDAYCIMSNHVHTVFAPLLSEQDLHERMTPKGLVIESDKPPLPAIMQSLKGYTARQINLALSRSSTFWDEEYYDHVVRDDAEFVRIVKYVLNNPVKAGLAQHWQDWKWSYQRAAGLSVR